MTQANSVVLPGATIGIFGGGQLGRMMALAARAMGYQVHVLDPDPGCPARPVVDHVIAAAFDDVDAAAELGRQCDVVTIEIEKVSLHCMRAAAHHAPVRPGAEVLEIVQDKGRQKRWLSGQGFPVGPFLEARTPAEVQAAVVALGGRCFVKSARGGYDGRGQVVLESADGAAEAFAELGGAPVVVEQSLSLTAELSMMVARSPSGEIKVYPPALNHHEDRILEWSLLPGPVSPAVALEAEQIARGLATRLELEGLLAVELFLTGDRLLVNELAPRPHNTFHSTEVGCATSQFEQAVRAVCGLPLGSVEVLRPAAIANLLGEAGGPNAPFDRALQVSGTRLFLYGKRDARPGRKMGHLSAIGATPEEALARVQEAKARLTGEKP